MIFLSPPKFKVKRFASSHPRPQVLMADVAQLVAVPYQARNGPGQVMTGKAGDFVVLQHVPRLFDLGHRRVLEFFPIFTVIGLFVVCQN